MNQRPEWAKGSAWDGWEKSHGIGVSIQRSTANGVEFTIYPSGRMGVLASAYIVLEFKTPADALAVAEFIASKLDGGWSK